MSTRREDDSRPSDREHSQRPTARDVPIARFKEASVGTSPPRGLRGPSLQPGQGAPERIVPEDIELAVLRDAETLDGPRVARAAARRLPDPGNSPSPTPVSVEVPRVRSIPPSLEPAATTPTSPSARSIQSGTLMSIGSIDPRAPTELSLPTPRHLSESERISYLGPEAVVDRSPRPVSVSDLLETPISDGDLGFSEVVDRPRSPNSEPVPRSSARSVPVGSGRPPPVSVQWTPDPLAPEARKFGREPPPSSVPLSSPPPHGPRLPARGSDPELARDAHPQFQVHAEINAVAHEFVDDAFDLRSASTQREPLASRKAQPSADWLSVHEPVVDARQSYAPGETRPSRNPSSSSAVTVLVDRGSGELVRVSLADIQPARRASVPLTWVIGAAIFALLLAVAVGYIMRAPSPALATHPNDDKSADSPRAPALAAPESAPAAGAVAAAQVLAPVPTAARSASSAVQPNAATSAAKAAPSSAAPHPSAQAQPAAPGEAKAHQSIY